MNNFQDFGRLAFDPGLKYFESGKSITSFRIAIDSAERDNDGKPKTTWLDCEAWANADGRGVGQVIAQYLQKGDLAYFAGRLKTEEWTDNTTGQNRQRLKLVVQDVKLLPRKNSESFIEDNDWADDRPTPKAEAKKGKPGAYASTASKGRAAADADGVQQADLEDAPISF